MRCLGLAVTYDNPHQFLVVITWDPGPERPGEPHGTFPLRQELRAESWNEVIGGVNEAIKDNMMLDIYARLAVQRALGGSPIAFLEAEVVIPDTRVAPVKFPFARYSGRISGSTRATADFAFDEAGEVPYLLPGRDYHILPV